MLSSQVIFQIDFKTCDKIFHLQTPGRSPPYPFLGDWSHCQERDVVLFYLSHSVLMAFPPTESLTLHIFFDEVVGRRVETEPDDEDGPVAIILNDPLAPLGLDSQDCNLNQFVLPMIAPSQRSQCPVLEHTSTHWTSWDTKLDQWHSYHLLILNQDVFANIKAEAEALEFSLSFGPPGGDLRCRSILHIHMLDMTELVDLCGRLHAHCGRLQAQINLLHRQVYDVRRDFGSALETLAALEPALIPILGLQRRRPNPEPEADP